jgi:tryptophanyl-tRNA synthetase
VLPTVASRVRDLSNPTRKMDKSADNSPGVVFVLDPPDVVRRKVRRAVTDGLGQVRYAPEEQPAVANLLEILAACTATSPLAAASSVTSYERLKEAVAEAVIEQLRPVRERTTELLADAGELDRIRKTSAERVRERSLPRLHAALEVVGLR